MILHPSLLSLKSVVISQDDAADNHWKKGILEKIKPRSQPLSVLYVLKWDMPLGAKKRRI